MPPVDHTVDMIGSILIFAVATAASSNSDSGVISPFVTPKVGTWLPDSQSIEATDERPWKDHFACCALDEESKSFKPVKIGTLPQMSSADSVNVLKHSVEAFAGGAGDWPQLSFEERCRVIENFLEELSKSRQEIADVLMWEIGKTRRDAEAEVDRTLSFARQVIQTVRTDPEYVGEWKSYGSTNAVVRRLGIGVVVCLAPYNYPLNESYAAIIPALLTGNVVLLKLPTIGGLAHILTIEAIRKHLPSGTLNFVSGSGRSTLPKIMETGLVDGLAFIGGSSAADELIHSHPNPHRLKVFLQLEANNMAILMEDIFHEGNGVWLENTLQEAILGALSFNGQRCTALKLFFVPNRFADKFAQALAERVSQLSVGLPWESSSITPLPSLARIAYMKSLLDDAIDKGAKIVNAGGGEVIGGSESTLMVPAVLYPVTEDMKIYHEEQFGPLIPITSYNDVEEALLFGQTGKFAQQVSVFTSDPSQASLVLDRFAALFGKINLNAQGELLYTLLLQSPNT